MRLRCLTQRLTWLLALLAGVIALGSSGILSAHASDPFQKYLFLTTATRYDALYDGLQVSGARVLHAFPSLGLIAEADCATADLQARLGHADHITAGSLPADVVASLTPEGRRLVAVWEALRAPETQAGSGEIHPPENDVRMASDGPELAGQALDPSLYQQSEFMIGKVAVNIVLIESSGAVDASTENWSAERQQLVFQEVVRATSWWQARRPQAQLEFVYEDHFSDPVPVSYEPISRPHYEDRLWIAEATQQLGYRHSSYLTATRLLNRATRDARQADWAFTIYVVDSLNDADNRFSDGHFAYAYIHGPYLVVTYGNNGYGPENMAAVVAHEIGHIFGALDGYAASGVTADYASGYLGVPTNNSEIDGHTDLGCIMRGGLQPFRLGQLCPCSAGQVGWRDSDGDGIYDPVDTEVQVELTLAADDEGVTLSGTVIDVPYPSPTRAHLTINRIALGRYRVNGGPWRPLGCGDGSCDSVLEQFRLRLPPACAGEWLIEVSFANNRGNTGAAGDTLVVTGAELPVAAVTLEADVELAEEGSVVVSGQARVEARAGALLALESRVDAAEWQAVEPDAVDKGGASTFSFALRGLTAGCHQVELRAAVADPWSLPATWTRTFEITAPPPQPSPGRGTVQYLPLIVSQD